MPNGLRGYDTDQLGDADKQHGDQRMDQGKHAKKRFHGLMLAAPAARRRMQKGLLEEIGFGDRQAHPRFTPSLRTLLAESSPKRGKQCQKFDFIVCLRWGKR